MSTQTFCLPDQAAGSSRYFRIFDSAGLVFDFNDNTFKAIASATTPYVLATERTAMGGTGKSSFTADVDLANVWNKPGSQFFLFAYAGGTPADGDAAISPTASESIILPSPSPWIEFGEFGRGEIIAEVEANVKSTAGTTAQLALWLARNGKKIPIATIDPVATGNITYREHGATSPLLINQNVTNANFVTERFEVEVSNPNFVNDRQYEAVGSITILGTTFQSHRSDVVFG